MKTLYSVILLCAVSNYSFANDEYSSLRQELKQMMELDQNTLRGKTGQDFETLRTKQANRVKEIVAEFGWPTVDMVGEEASQAAWIIVQHADYAYLYDRTHSPQLYGTQGKCEGTNFIPFPVQDIKDIDSRRHEMNMTTAQEYWDMASERMCRR